MAQRAGAVKSILIRPAVRVFDPILRCPDAYGRRRTVSSHPERHSTVSVAPTPPCDRRQRGDDRAFLERGAQWLVCTIIIQRSVTPSGGWR